ncbi:hypothetical protein Tco_0424748 [Tanacetum coccineum]
MEGIHPFVDGIWEPLWAWRRQTIGRSEGEVSSITSLLNGLVLDPAHDDKWVWSLEASGEFTVKSLSHVIQKKLLASNMSDVAHFLRTHRSHGIYESLLLLMPKNQDSLAEDLELVEGSGNKIIHATSPEEANSARHEDIFSAVKRLYLLWIFNRAPIRSRSWDLWVL